MSHADLLTAVMITDSSLDIGPVVTNNFINCDEEGRGVMAWCKQKMLWKKD
jgi:hypothetical protein